MSDYTDITVLLDRSGSMRSIAESMESGFDEFLSQHRANPSTKLTLIQFDGENPQETVYIARSIGSAPKLQLYPRGMTPLNDALCMAIDGTGQRLARMRESDRPRRVLFIVITDGLENASNRYGRNDVRNRITHQRDRYSWEFVYLGANQNAIEEAADMGMDWKKAITYVPTLAATTGTWRGLASNTLNYASTGIAANMDWSVRQRQTAIDSGEPEDINTTKTDGTT